MVIGKGLVAGSFGSYAEQEGFLIFASGVSNSKSSTEADFRREAGLLQQSIEQNPGKQLVYFITTSVEDPDLYHAPYSQHKLQMEEWIRTNAHAYTIFRLSNLA